MSSTTTNTADQLRIVTLCYRYAFMRARQQMGSLTRSERIIWAVLQRMLEGPAGWQTGDEPLSPAARHRPQRSHRRMRLGMLGELRLNGQRRAVVVRDISGAGMYLVTPHAVPLDTMVEVRLCHGQETEYIFSCRVVRHGASGEPPGVGLRLLGIPLELRRTTTKAA